MRRPRNAPLGQYVRARYPDGARWLDIGAGDGAVSIWLASRLAGPSSYACYDIRPRGPGVLAFDGLTVPRPDWLGAPDFVLFNWVLHHAGHATECLLRSALEAAPVVLIQEDMLTPESADSCTRHDPAGVFRSHEDWLQLLHAIGGVVTHDELLPELSSGDEPGHVCPRRLFVYERR